MDKEITNRMLDQDERNLSLIQLLQRARERETLNDETARKLDEIEKLVVTGDIKKHIVELPCLFDDCGMIVLKPFADRLAYNGNKIVQSDIDYINTVENKDYRLYASTKTFVGIYKKCDGEYKPVKMFL